MRINTKWILMTILIGSMSSVLSTAEGDVVGRLWECLQAFSQIGSRPAGSQQALMAGDYFQKQMRSLGYVVRKQKFSVEDVGSCANWVADKPGTSNGFFIVAAHLDTVAGSSGINDDASGVAALIEIAKELHDVKLQPGVRFAAFGAEEELPGLRGHNHGAGEYLDALPTSEVSRIQGAIYLDKIGRGDRLRIRRSLKRDPSLARRLQPVAFNILGQPKSAETNWTISISPFGQYMIPVAWVEWSPDPSVHSKSDTLDRIEVQRIVETIKVVVHFLKGEPPPHLSQGQ